MPIVAMYSKKTPQNTVVYTWMKMAIFFKGVVYSIYLEKNSFGRNKTSVCSLCGAVQGIFSESWRISLAIDSVSGDGAQEPPAMGPQSL